MVADLSLELIHATVQLEQPLADGTRTVGTGFLIQAPRPDGTPRTVLVTAAHVFEKMPNEKARIGYRVANADGSWSYTPQSLPIRTSGGDELWTKHPTRDVAAIAIQAPEAFAKAAIPLNWLAADDTFAKQNVTAGDEMMALGFPRGLAANQAGFPILRSGRVASWPVAPANIYPTFLLDFSVFPGNSGGPVFMSDPAKGPEGDGQFIAGLLTQQVELNKERLEIGIVTHAKYIRETIALLGKGEQVGPPTQIARDEGVDQAVQTASAAVAASADRAVSRD
jgi:V8-like Glu-specific endopeptidase